MSAACGPLVEESRGQIHEDCRPLWPSKGEVTAVGWWEAPQSDAACEDVGGEACAVEELQAVYKTCTGGTLDFKDLGDKEATLTELENPESYTRKTAPSYVAIVNAGVDVWRLAKGTRERNYEESNLMSLGPLKQPVANFLRDRTPDFLRHLVSHGDQQYGVIVGLHRLNQFFYKTSITNQPHVAAALAAEGVDLSKPSLELEHLSAMLKVLSGISTEPSRPLLLADNPGALSTFVIENVMVALAEKKRGIDHEDGYTRFWKGLTRAPDSDVPTIDMRLFNEALEVVQSLAQYIQLETDPESKESIVHQQSIVHQLSNDADKGAVFTVAGDWEKATLPDNIGDRGFPGTDGVYVYTADAAVVPPTRDALTEQHSVVSFLKVLTSVMAQDPYHQLKHSLGPVTSSNGRTEAKSTTEMFGLLEPRAGLPAHVPHLSFDALESEVGEFVRCLVELPVPPSSSNQDPCGRAALSKYVFDQYCEVVTGPDGQCTQPKPRREPR